MNKADMKMWKPTWEKSAAAVLLLLTLEMQLPVCGAATWVPTTPGTYSWNSNANWSPAAFPNAVGAVAELTKDFDGSPMIVNLNQAITVGTMTTGDTATDWRSMTINANGGSLTFQVASGDATLTKSNVGASNHGIHDTFNTDIQLNSNLVVANNSPNNADSHIVFSNPVSGAGNLTIAGTGLVRLSAANTFTGTTTPTTGRLQLNHTQALQNSTYLAVSGNLAFVSGNNGTANAFTFGGLASSGNISLQNNASAAVALSAGNNNADTTYSGVMSGTGSFTKIGSGKLILQGANSFSGGLTISSGTVEATSTALLGTGIVTLNNANTGSANTRLVFNNASVSLSNSIVVANQGTGVATIATDSSAVLPTFGALTLNKAVTFDILTGTSLRSNQGNSFSGSGNLLKTGAGRLALNSLSSTYTGNITLSQGTINWGATGSLGSGTITINDSNTGSLNTTLNSQNAGTLANNIIVANQGTGTVTIGTFNAGQTGVQTYSGTLSLGRSITIEATNPHGTIFSGVISGAGGITKTQSQTVTLSNANTFSGNTRVFAGTLALTDALALQNSTLDMNSGDAGSVSFGAPAAFTLGGLTGSRNLNMNGKTLSIGNNDANTTYTGVLSNGSLTKIGAGTLTLTAANSYTGNTLVSAGTLSLGAGGSLTSNVTVQSGATFAGSGTVDGDLTIQAGGFHRPGNSPGITVVDGDYTQAGTLYIDIDGNAGPGVAGGHDLVQVIGGLVTLGGSLVVAGGPALQIGDAWVILDNFGSDLITTTFLDWAQGEQKIFGSYGYTIDYQYNAGTDMSANNDVRLVLTYLVPEPTTFILGLPAAALLAGYARRRRRRAK